MRAHLANAGYGLLDYAASDLARGLGFGLAVDLHLESLGMRAESRYRRF